MKSNPKQRQQTNDLTPGGRWILDGQIVEIDGAQSSSAVSVRIEATGEMRCVPVARLLAIPSTNPGQDARAIPAEEWSRVVAIARDIEPLAQHPTVPRELLIEVANKYCISVRHVQRLLAKFRINPKSSALAKRKAGRPNGARMLAAPVEAVITHVIKKYFLRREPVSQEDVVERARSICRRSGLPAPSRGAVRRRIAQHNAREADLRKLGARQAGQRWKPRPGTFSVRLPLDVVQIDHTLVDLMVLSDDRKDVLGRPWLTAAIDVATRVVLGFYLSMDPPSSISVGLCIAHAALPKPEDAQEPGLWPMFGKMKVIHVDNGKDLISSAIQRGCEEHGIQLKTRPAGKPHYGGHIERLMGSLMRMIHGLPGTTFSNIKEKRDYDSERKATLTLMELHEWMLHKIGRFYHARLHRILGVPPLVAWERAWRSEDGYVMLPPLVARPEEFRLDFFPFQLRRVQRTGVQLWGSRYWSDALECLVHPEGWAQVHYHPHELSRIWVHTPEGRYIEARAVAGPAAGQARLKSMNAAERLHMEEVRDAGFTACDRIENMATSASRALARQESRRNPKDDRARRRKIEERHSTEAPPDIPLDRASIQVKRFV